MTIWPVDSSVSQEYGSNPTASLPADSWLIQTFGNYQPNGHTGVDFPVQVGTPVRAAAGGTVKHVGWYGGSYADNPYWISPSFAGFVLVIDHGAFIGIYAHLSGSPVAVGEYVREGQTVAYSGNSGGSTGPHLHFEVLPDGWDFNNGMYGRVNPAQYITTGGAAIAPESSTITPAKDWFDMASIDDLRKVLDEKNPWGYRNSKLERDDAYALLRATRTLAVNSKAELAAIKSIVSQLAKNQGVAIDYAKVDQIVKDNLAAGVSVDVNVNGKSA